MAIYNPLYLNSSTNTWTAVDNTLSADPMHTRTVMYSGDRLFFGGNFIYNFTNANNVANFQLPAKSYQVGCVGYFDTTINRIQSIGAIGTFTEQAYCNSAACEALSTFDLQNSVNCLTLCGANLVAAGYFKSINTQITGFQALTAMPTSIWFELSDTPPFNTGILSGQVITVPQYNLIFTNLYTMGLATSFMPKLSGNPAVNIAYYSPTIGRWQAFPNTTNVDFSSGVFLACETYNNIVYATGFGTGISGGLYYNSGNQWNQVTPSISNNCENTSDTPTGFFLYNDQRGNLIYCGSFDSYTGDTAKSGIMKYNGSVFSAIGNGFDGSPNPYATCAMVTLSGDNYIAVGNFPDKIAWINRSTGTTWTKLYNGTAAAAGFITADTIACMDLSGNNMVFGGAFDLDPATPNTNGVAAITNNNVTGMPQDIYGIDDLFALGRLPRVLFANVPVDYSVNTTIAADFTTAILQSHRDTMLTTSGISAYSTAPYQGVDGIIIT